MNRPRMPTQLSFAALNNASSVSTSKIDNRRVDSLIDHCHAIVVESVGRVARSVVVSITVESHVRNHDGVVSRLPVIGMVGPYDRKRHDPSPFSMERKNLPGRENGLGPVPEWSYSGRPGGVPAESFVAVGLFE